MPDPLQWLFEKLGIFNLPSPRSELLKQMVYLLTPTELPDLSWSGYFDQVQLFWKIAFILFAIGFVVRLGIALNAGTYQEQGKLFLVDFVLFGAGPPAITAALTTARVISVSLVSVFVVSMYGDRDKFIETIGVTTGFASIDWLLAIVQIGALLYAIIMVVAINIAFEVSAFSLILGSSVRWAGRYGESVMATAVAITVYGTVGNLLFFGILAGFSRIGRWVFGDTGVAIGLVNTLAIVVAGLSARMLFKHFKSRLRTFVKGTLDEVRNIRNGGKTSSDTTTSHTQTRADEEHSAARQYSDNASAPRRQRDNDSGSSSSSEPQDGRDHIPSSRSGHTRTIDEVYVGEQPSSPDVPSAVHETRSGRRSDPAELNYANVTSRTNSQEGEV